MKDEFGGVIIIEFVGLKSKMYSIKKIDGKEHNTAKGVSITTEFDKFKDVLFNKKLLDTKWKEFKVKKDKLGTYEIDKISLSCFNDKRYVLDDGIYTLSYFHKYSVTNWIIKKNVIIKKNCDYYCDHYCDYYCDYYRDYYCDYYCDYWKRLS